MKYCSFVIFFCGVRVNVSFVMGMLGFEIVLEEFICRVFGQFVYEGIVVKIVDDFYCGGNILEQFIYNWERVLDVFQKNRNFNF